MLYLNVLFALLTVYKLFVLGKDGLSWLEMGYAERNLELAQQLHAYYQKTFPNEIYGIMLVDEPALTSPLAQIA